MSSPESTLSLTDIGDELDRARLARHGVNRGRGQGRRMSELEAVSETESTELSETSPVTRLTMPETGEHAGSVCVCCLTRPPSAILLPCCHLNLCYLCAPLLILKGQNPSPSTAPTSPPTLVSTSPTRVSYYEALKQATANHPQSRRMSMGHCDPPDRGTLGAEIKGSDLIQVAQDQSRGEHEAEGGDQSGLRAKRGDDGRLNLDCEDDGRGARCLVCRSAVTGWLRVYSG